MRLSSGSPDINIYYWADRPDIQIDWEDIYDTWPDNELLLREAVMTYLLNASDTGSRVYKNESFRDATFEAWAAFNGAAMQRVDFSNSSYYESCATNTRFMKWWVELAISDKSHEPGLTWFLESLESHLHYLSAEDEVSQLEETLKVCLQAASEKDSRLQALLTELLEVIETNRMTDNEGENKQSG